MNKNKIETVEIWKPIPGYEGYYEVSNLGRVKSLPRYRIKEPRIIKPHISRQNGYVYVSLCKNNRAITFRVHRAVMEAFTDYRGGSYDANKQIDHINGIKTDNRLENLEVVTQSENTTRAYKKHLIHCCTKKVICLDTGEIFNSITDAAKSVGGHKCNSVTRVCQGKRSQYRNFHFAYYDDYVNGTIPEFNGRAKKSCEWLWVK